jgi:hypothetical protein
MQCHGHFCDYLCQQIELWIYGAVSVLWLSFVVNVIYVLRSAVWYCNLIVLWFEV